MDLRYQELNKTTSWAFGSLYITEDFKRIEVYTKIYSPMFKGLMCILDIQEFVRECLIQKNVEEVT